MNRFRVGTVCLVAAMAGLVALWVLAYGWGLRNGLRGPERQEFLRELKEASRGSKSWFVPDFTTEDLIAKTRQRDYLVLGVFSLLPLSLACIGLWLRRAQH